MLLKFLCAFTIFLIFFWYYFNQKSFFFLISYHCKSFLNTFKFLTKKYLDFHLPANLNIIEIVSATNLKTSHSKTQIN